MTIWETQAVMAEWAKAHGVDDKKLSADEKDELWDWLGTQSDVPLSLGIH